MYGNTSTARRRTIYDLTMSKRAMPFKQLPFGAPPLVPVSSGAFLHACTLAAKTTRAGILSSNTAKALAQRQAMCVKRIKVTIENKNTFPTPNKKEWLDHNAQQSEAPRVQLFNLQNTRTGCVLRQPSQSQSSGFIGRPLSLQPGKHPQHWSCANVAGARDD